MMAAKSRAMAAMPPVTKKVAGFVMKTTAANQFVAARQVILAPPASPALE